MQVALITVGDEVLSGDTVNTNANWLATRLSERGATVARILSVPDKRETITEHVTTYRERFDAAIVTGGIGGTPDDVTMEAVADAFDREMTVREEPLADVRQRLAEIEQRLPDMDINVDAESEAALPAGSRPLLNEEGLAPGCVLENVYVFPGIPEELEAMFEQVADEFTGDRRTRTLYTVEPEANIVPRLEDVMATFDVTVGCYPDREAGHNRLKIIATDDGELGGATEWLLDNLAASETSVSRDWDTQ
ncbi:competence/damage-inducible protein A [Halovenus salina]|uniref:Competence/damage-inducible protein A n=1 Tax=Halovenus salina TaxID=1510225 RepID=A0ABD5W4V5_9EURY|nr:molybdopterin-binding protein [Halovenus salina]